MFFKIWNFYFASGKDVRVLKFEITLQKIERENNVSLFLSQKTNERRKPKRTLSSHWSISKYADRYPSVQRPSIIPPSNGLSHLRLLYPPQQNGPNNKSTLYKSQPSNELSNPLPEIFPILSSISAFSLKRVSDSLLELG